MEVFHFTDPAVMLDERRKLFVRSNGVVPQYAAKQLQKHGAVSFSNKFRQLFEPVKKRISLS